MNKVELSITALAKSEACEGNFILVLDDHRGNRRLPITIGKFEAQSIAAALQQKPAQRPIMHDVFKAALHALKATLKEVVISAKTDSVFHAILVLQTPTDGDIELDARPSDAIAMAVRFGKPIFAYDTVLDTAALFAEDRCYCKEHQLSLADCPLRELERLLEDAIMKEDYETAAKMRSMIVSKKNMHQ